VRTSLALPLAAWFAGARGPSPDPGTNGSEAQILHWEAPEGCPTQGEVAVTIAELVPSAAAGDGTARVRATVVREGERFRLTLWTTYAETTEQHVLESGDCRELAQSVAMIVGALSHSDVSSETPVSVVPERAAIGGAAEAAVVQKMPPPERGPEQELAPSRRRPRGAPALGVGAGLGLDLGSIEAPAALTELAIGPAWARVRLEATARFVLPRPVSQGEFRGLYWQWALAPRACVRWVVRRVELPLCGALEVGQVHGYSQAPSPTRSGVHLWVAPVFGAGVTWFGRRAGVRAVLETGVRLVGSDFQANGVDVLTPWPVSFRAVVGFLFDLRPNFAGARTFRTRP